MFNLSTKCESPYLQRQLAKPYVLAALVDAALLVVDLLLPYLLEYRPASILVRPIKFGSSEKNNKNAYLVCKPNGKRHWTGTRTCTITLAVLAVACSMPTRLHLHQHCCLLPTSHSSRFCQACLRGCTYGKPTQLAWPVFCQILWRPSSPLG